MEKVVPRETGYGSGLCAAWYDGSFLIVIFRLSSGADGHVSGTVDYDVFGEPVTETGVFADSAGGSGGISSLVFAYAGKPYDSVTGLSDYGFRDYASGLARFTTVDPICAMRSCDRKLIVHVRSREHAIRDGSNWYAYCNSDPVNYVDLWGLTASDKGGNGNNGLYGERYHNGKYVMTVDVNNPEAFDAALSAYSGVRKYGAAGTTPVDSIALTDSSGQIIHTFSDEEAMLRYANANTTPTTQQTEEIAFSFGIGGKAALLLGIGLEFGVIVDKSFNIYLYGSASIGLGIQTPAAINGNTSINNYMKNSIGKQSSISLNPSKIGFSSSNTADISLGIGGTYDLNNLNNSGVPNAVSFGNIGGGIWKTGTIITPIFKRD